MCLGIIAKLFSLVFFGKEDALRNQTPNNSDEYEHRREVFMWFKEKDQSTLLSLQPYVSWRLWFGKCWWNNSLYDKELTYKQLWCAPLQRDAAWEKKTKKHKNPTLCWTSQLWNTMKQWKGNKANIMTACWSSQSAITLICEKIDAVVWLNKRVMTGRVTGRQKNRKDLKVKSVTINSSLLVLQI